MAIGLVRGRSWGGPHGRLPVAQTGLEKAARSTRSTGLPLKDGRQRRQDGEENKTGKTATHEGDGGKEREGGGMKKRTRDTKRSSKNRHLSLFPFLRETQRERDRERERARRKRTGKEDDQKRQRGRQDGGRGPAGNTGRRGSCLRSGGDHWPWMVVRRRRRRSQLA